MKTLEAVPQNWQHKIKLTAVPKDGTAYEEQFSIEEKAPVSYWGQLYSFNTPLCVSVKIYRAEANLYTDISVSGIAETACARCLEPAKSQILGELKYLFTLAADEESRTKEEKEGLADGDEDRILLDSWEDEIDISPQIWEVMMTALPAVILCKADCKGLCPECGASLNNEKCNCKKAGGDARFELLKQLMEEK